MMKFLIDLVENENDGKKKKQPVKKEREITLHFS